MNSPWGLYYSIIEKTGWTWHYMLWKVSWINIQMMLADAPRYKSKPKDEVTREAPLKTLKAFLDE
ncbi:hypothetical protein AB6735_18745 [Mucilaginibacter sp. RCC_168]|uniref:hypothetical protein n=1 Tax=Mucilaginibacter sp. RCC_168 TaxID=3239221 RepID=UPI00352613E7